MFIIHAQMRYATRTKLVEFRLGEKIKKTKKLYNLFGGLSTTIIAVGYRGDCDIGSSLGKR